MEVQSGWLSLLWQLWDMEMCFRTLLVVSYPACLLLYGVHLSYLYWFSSQQVFLNSNKTKTKLWDSSNKAGALVNRLYWHLSSSLKRRNSTHTRWKTTQILLSNRHFWKWLWTRRKGDSRTRLGMNKESLHFSISYKGLIKKENFLVLIHKIGFCCSWNRKLKLIIIKNWQLILAKKWIKYSLTYRNLWKLSLLTKEITISFLMKMKLRCSILIEL